MDLDYSADERAFRDEVRAWLRDHLPAATRDKVARYAHLDSDDLLRWHRILAEQGLGRAGVAAGMGRHRLERRAALHLRGGDAATPARRRSIPFGLAMCAPVLLRFGTDAQKQRFLPRIYHGEDFWCQGYSEPGSGSRPGVAARRPRCGAGDHYVVNGQKIWTTLAHYADWIFCLVRTDATSGSSRTASRSC